jgi:hypothetical protein
MEPPLGQRPLCDRRFLHLCPPPVRAVVELQQHPRISPPRNKLIAITKVKIIILYKACKCDCSIAIGACGVAILQEVVSARMQELHIDMEYGTGARSYILKRCQELHFNYCIQYSLQI